MEPRARKNTPAPDPGRSPASAKGKSSLTDFFRQPAGGRRRTQQARRGSTLFSEEDRADGAYLLVSGRVKLSRLTPSGKEILLELVEPGGVFGLREALGEGFRLETATVLMDAEVVRIGVRELEEALPGSPRLLRDVLGHLLARVERIERRMELLMTETVPKRLGHALLELVREEGNGSSGSVGLTHQDMGNLVGTSRETVSLFLARFRQRGWVATERGRVRILDPKGLQAWLESEESPEEVTGGDGGPGV